MPRQLLRFRVHAAGIQEKRRIPDEDHQRAQPLLDGRRPQRPGYLASSIRFMTPGILSVARRGPQDRGARTGAAFLPGPCGR